MRALLVSVLALFVAIATCDDFRNDPRLSKPIAARLKVAPLSALIKQMADDTGVGIYVAPYIADRKITAIFKDRPASEAMEMLAKTLFCEWSSEPGGYRLEMPIEAQRQESGLLDAEQAVLKERIADVVGKMVAVTSEPKEQLTEERDKMNLQLNQMRGVQDPKDRQKLDALRREYSRRFDWLGWWDVGYALRNAPSGADDLASGATLFASTDRAGALPLPLSSIPQFSVNILIPNPDGGPPKAERRSPTGAVTALRVNPATGRLQTKTMGTGLGPTAAGFTGRDAWLIDTGEAENKLYNLPLRKRIREWARNVDTRILNAKLAHSEETPPSPGYSSRSFTIAEHLEHLADAAGIPVIADAYRLPASSEAYLSASTVGEYLRQLRDQINPDLRGGYIRTEKGWIMYRHPRYWRLIASEIPEKVFAPFESAKTKDRMSMNDYAAFASALTPWQAFVFPYRTPLTRFPRLPLIHAIPALRLWASLDSGQRQAAYTSGLSIASMSGGQRDLYRVAVTELLWVGALNETFLPFLMKGNYMSGELGFFMQDANSGAQPMYLGESEYSQDKPHMYTREDIDKLRPGAYTFRFGTSVDSGATYNFTLSPGGS